MHLFCVKEKKNTVNHCNLTHDVSWCTNFDKIIQIEYLNSLNLEIQTKTCEQIIIK